MFYHKDMASKNPEARREYNRKYHKKNREKRLADFKARYAEKAEERKAYQKAYREANPDKVRATQLKYNYGITIDDYERMLEAQGGCCAVCGANEPGDRRRKNFCVDHCHETGEVRGLLCVHCNMLIGRYGDSEELLKRFIAYLAKD